MRRLNCWEFTGCGLQEARAEGERPNLCPARTERRLHGIHGGTNAGRACWAVLGTQCGGKIQANLKQKYEACGECDFYRVVKVQEGGELELTVALLSRLAL